MNNLLTNKTLTLFRLVMINIIAVDSLRNISITAQAGWIVVTFYLLAGLLFLVPCVLLTAEMATGSPDEIGGIYVWAKKAFGKRFGFIIIWLQWIYNLVWFPSICGFFAAVIAYILAPNLGQNPANLISNPWYMISMSLVMFWGATAINLFGIKTSSLVSSLGAVIGTIIPMIIIISLAIGWSFFHSDIISKPTVSNFIPSSGNISSWALFITVMFSLFGLEMSAIHASNVQNPKKNFPRALLISGSVILFTLVLSNIAVIIVSQQLDIGDVDIVSGLMVSFNYFFAQMGIPWFSNIIAITLVFGAFTTTSAWIMGLSRAFLAVSEDGILPKSLNRTNQNDAPDRVLIIQGLIFTVFCFSYIFLPSVIDAYWYLSDLTAQLAVIAYIGMFLSAIKIKYKYKAIEGQFKISNGIYGTVIVASLGILSCIVAMVVGFIPIENTTISTLKFDIYLISGILISLMIPYLIVLYKDKLE